jgi:catecholate siderophore receptor
MVRHHSLSPIIVAALLMPTGADASDAGVDAETIIVTGQTDGYRIDDTSSGTKTNTPILDIPQSISIITEAQLRDQQILTIADLVRYIPGVSAGQGEGHRDQITLRGNNSTADFFVDGLRDDVQYLRSLYNIDRVEVLKGPNAMAFGRGGGGGVLNRLTKGARVGETKISGTASINSFAAWYAAVDANLPLGSAALRVNGFYEHLDNHRDAFGGERYGINPVLGAQIGDRVKLQLGYEYARDQRVVDRGIPSAFAGTIAAPASPAPGLRDRFFGVSGINDTGFTAHMIRFGAEAKLTDGLTLSTRALYGSYDKSYTNVYAATAIGGTPAAPSVGVEAYSEFTQRKNFIGQANLEWRGSTGGIDHIILVGGEITDQGTSNERITGFFDPVATDLASRRRVIALTNPLLVPRVRLVAGAAGNSNRSVASNLKQRSLYAQDQIGLGNRIDLIAGLRYDRFDLSVTNRFSAQRFSRTDDLWSPRLGLVFKPVPNASVYLSYAKSFLPQAGDQFLSLDLTSAALKPETFDNYEMGAKWNITPGLTATTAIYRLDRTNTRAVGPVPGTTVLTGAQRTSGFEFGVTGKITAKWQTALGYAYTKAEITDTTAAAPAGRQIGQVPRHQFSLWNRYDLNDNLGLGLGIYHQARQFTSISNTTRLPAYTRIDAALFFKLFDGLDAQINIENLTNTTYFPVAHNDNNITPGAPINARFTLSAKF